MKLSGRWAGAWAVVIWCSAPLLPALRSYLNETAPSGFDRYVAWGLLAVSTAVIALVWVCRRGDRVRALGELILVLTCFAVLYALLASPDPRTNLVELAHFVEYGTLAILAFASFGGLSQPARWVQALLLVVAVGLVDESIQWALASRVAEIRDVALNAAAGGLGLSYVVWVLRIVEDHSARLTRGEMRQVVTVGVILLPAVAAFLYVVHLGYGIQWGDIQFVSRYHASEIERVGEDRRARWASWDPVDLKHLRRPEEQLWALEDFYVTEARRHIQARNEAADGGDVRVATGENLIVERWYSPYLEVTGAERTDLPVELEEPTYRSLVLQHLWPGLASPMVWGAFIAAELALVGLAVYLGRVERKT